MHKPTVSAFKTSTPGIQSATAGVPVLNLTGIHIPPPSGSNVKLDSTGFVGLSNSDTQTNRTVGANLAIESPEKSRVKPENLSGRESQNFQLSIEGRYESQGTQRSSILPNMQRKSLKKITEASIPASTKNSHRDLLENFSDQKLQRKDIRSTQQAFSRFPHLSEVATNTVESSGCQKHIRATNSLDRKVLPEISKHPGKSFVHVDNLASSQLKKEAPAPRIEEYSPVKQLTKSSKGSASDYFRGKRPVVLERETYSEAKPQASILTRLRQEKELSLTGRVNSRFFVSSSLHPEDVLGKAESKLLTTSRLSKQGQAKEESAWAVNSQTVQGVVEELTSSFRKSAIGLQEAGMQSPDRTAQDFTGVTATPAHGMTSTWRNLRAEGMLLPDRGQAVKMGGLLNSLTALLAKCQVNVCPSGKIIEELISLFEAMVSDSSKYSAVMRGFLQVIRSAVFIGQNSRNDVIQDILYINDPELNSTIFDPRHQSTHKDLVTAMVTGYSHWKFASEQQETQLKAEITTLKQKLTSAETELATRDRLCLGKKLDMQELGQEPRQYLLAAYDEKTQLVLLESDVMRKLLELGESYKTSWTNETNYLFELEETKKQLERLRQEKHRLESTLHSWEDFKGNLELKLDTYEVSFKQLSSTMKEVELQIQKAKSHALVAGLGIKVDWQEMMNWKMRETLGYPQGAELDTGDILKKMKDCIERLERQNEAEVERIESLKEEICRLNQLNQMQTQSPNLSLKRNVSKNTKTQRELTHSITAAPMSIMRLGPVEFDSKRSQKSNHVKNGSDHGLDTPGLPKSPEKSLIISEAEAGRLNPKNRYASMGVKGKLNFANDSKLGDSEEPSEVSPESPRKRVQSRDHSPIRSMTVKLVRLQDYNMEPSSPGLGSKRNAPTNNYFEDDGGSIQDAPYEEDIEELPEYIPPVPEETRVQKVLDDVFAGFNTQLGALLDKTKTLQQDVVETHHMVANFYPASK